jgi:AcrR family transcriptional regulator
MGIANRTRASGGASAAAARGGASGGAKATASRVERRRLARHQRLLAAAAKRFAAHGLDGVRLEVIADDADVARGTLYSHFATKEALVAAIVRPVLEHALDRLAGLSVAAGPGAVNELIELWLELWRDHADAMRVMQQARSMPLGDLAGLHGAVLERVLGAMSRAGTAGALRVDDPALAARMVARLAVPLLELCGSGTVGEERFRSSLHGLLLRR